MPEYISKNGKSPFEFDDFGESSRIMFGIKQQIYGPTLGLSRRAYAFDLVYDEGQKSIGLEFKIFNFGYNNNTSKF